MKNIYKPFAVLMLVALSACQIIGAPAPKTYSERLAGGYTTVISIRDTARVLLQGNAISADDAQNIQNLADQARTGLDLARTFGATPKGEDRLATSLIILTELQTYLAKRSPK